MRVGAGAAWRAGCPNGWSEKDVLREREKERERERERRWRAVREGLPGEKKERIWGGRERRWPPLLKKKKKPRGARARLCCVFALSPFRAHAASHPHPPTHPPTQVSSICPHKRWTGAAPGRRAARATPSSASSSPLATAPLLHTPPPPFPPPPHRTPPSPPTPTPSPACPPSSPASWAAA
jgi:hypothetical protein